MTADQVKKRIEDEGIEYFLCSFVEMSGAPKAKLVPASIAPSQEHSLKKSWP